MNQFSAFLLEQQKSALNHLELNINESDLNHALYLKALQKYKEIRKVPNIYVNINIVFTFSSIYIRLHALIPSYCFNKSLKCSIALYIVY